MEETSDKVKLINFIRAKKLTRFEDIDLVKLKMIKEYIQEKNLNIKINNILLKCRDQVLDMTNIKNTSVNNLINILKDFQKLIDNENKSKNENILHFVRYYEQTMQCYDSYLYYPVTTDFSID